MAAPATQRGAGVLGLDCGPKCSRKPVLPTFRGNPRQESYAEHPTGAITHLLGEGQGLARAAVGVVDLPGGEGEVRQLGQGSTHPPGHAGLTRELQAGLEQLDSTPVVPLIARDRPQRPQRLGHAPAIREPLVDQVTGLDEFVRPPEIGPPAGR